MQLSRWKGEMQVDLLRILWCNNKRELSLAGRKLPEKTYICIGGILL